MDFNKMVIFGSVKKRLDWLNQRQKVLSQNVANADTPGYRPRDLKPLDFGRELKKQTRPPMEMAKTSPLHIRGAVRDNEDFRSPKERRPYETAPAGNSVVLEEQMGKISETGMAHRLTTELYKKHLNMFKIAIGKGR